MQILESSARFNTEITIKEEWVPQISTSNQYLITLYKEFSKTTNPNIKLLRLLKRFNNKIKSVNIEALTYTIKFYEEEIVLPFDSMGKAERLFIVMYIADQLKKPLIVCYEISLLAMPAFRLLFEMFNNSEFIVVVPPDNHFKILLDSMQNEWGGGK